MDITRRQTEERIPRRRPWFFLAVLAVFLLLLALGGIPRWRRHVALAQASERLQTDAKSVAVVKPTRASDNGVTLPGSLVATQVATVNARSSGYVQKWYFDIGASVKAGQVLADIQAPEVSAEFRQAQAQTAQARAGLRQSESDLGRLGAAVMQATAQRDASDSALLHARATAASYRAKVVEAQRLLEQAQATERQDAAQLVLAERSWNRYRTLGAQGFVTQEEVDTARATRNSAQAKVEADQSAVRTAQATVSDAEANLRAAESDVVSALANIRAANENIHATEAALSSGKEVVNANRANVSASLENEKRYQVLQGFEKIVAPFDGVVTARNVDVGTLVNVPTTNTSDTDPNNTAPRTGLFGVARLDPIEIDVQMPQTYATATRVGQPADVYVRELPGEQFVGRIQVVSGALDATTRTLQTRIIVRNPIGRLRPGMYANVRVRGMNVKPLVHIPSNALVFYTQGTRVAVVTSDNKIHMQPVSVGRDYGTDVEILSGLRGDETLVSTPTDDLSEGTAVQISSPKSGKKGG